MITRKIKIVGISILTLIFSLDVFSQTSSQEKDEHISIYFIDDFKEDNEVSLTIEEIDILKSYHFRKSDIPQLKGLHPISIEIKANGIRIYNKGKLIEEIDKSVSLKSILKLKVFFNNKQKELDIKLLNGNYIFISLKEGEIDVKQSDKIG